MKIRPAVKPQKTEQWRNRLGQLPELREAERFREAEQMNQAMNDQQDSEGSGHAFLRRTHE